MELADVIRKRRMVRAFESRALDREQVDRILEVIQHAPSAGFSQGTEFLVFDGPDEVAKLLVAADSNNEDAPRAGSLANAQLLIVPLACKDAYLDRYAEPDKGWTDRDEGRWPVPYWHVDAGMAIMLALLTAVDLGLGGHFFGIEPDQIAPLRSAFGVPDRFEPVGVIAVGWKAPGERQSGSPATRTRRPPAEVLHRGHW